MNTMRANNREGSMVAQNLKKIQSKQKEVQKWYG